MSRVYDLSFWHLADMDVASENIRYWVALTFDFKDLGGQTIEERTGEALGAEGP